MSKDEILCEIKKNRHDGLGDWYYEYGLDESDDLEIREGYWSCEGVPDLAFKLLYEVKHLGRNDVDEADVWTLIENCISYCLAENEAHHIINYDDRYSFDEAPDPIIENPYYGHKGEPYISGYWSINDKRFIRSPFKSLKKYQEAIE